ncbi:hypothetical protein [Mesorhizobium amorphae]|uniref:hypothetical protein n=1 Tax=Mesorhizobium amorphae TaxID=71433 RepID=UPI0016425D5C|nr:hypothetical protein [Mesorhizobium amorphae]
MWRGSRHESQRTYQIVFIITVVIAVIALLMGLSVFSLGAISAFWVMTLAYVILAVACLLRGA